MKRCIAGRCEASDQGVDGGSTVRRRQLVAGLFSSVMGIKHPRTHATRRLPDPDCVRFTSVTVHVVVIPSLCEGAWKK